ncbi:MAG: SH3 domain-containing protein [Alphaproteobacteria bacterium]
MPQSVGSPRISVGRTVVAVGLLLGWPTVSSVALGQEATTTKPSLTDELLLSTSRDDDVAAKASDTLQKIGKTPSFEELDSAASDLNEALSGARAKLDELRQATELAAMAAELREELEDSIQENNRLAASLAEVQSERSDLETQNSEAQRKIIELTDTVERSKLEIAEQAEQLQRRQDRIDEVDEARANAEEQVRQLEADLVNTGDEVDQLRGEIAELTGVLEATRTELDESNGKAEEAREARNNADRELSKVRKQIAGMLRSVLLGGEPIDVSQLEEEDPSLSEDNNFGLGVPYQAIRASNVRSQPDPDSERVGFAKRGDAITVLKKVADRNWFEIETADGVRGYIFGDLIKPGA